MFTSIFRCLQTLHPEQESFPDLSFVEGLPLDPLEVSVHDVSFSVGNEGLERGHCLTIDPLSSNIPRIFYQWECFYLDETNESRRLECFHCKVVENSLKSG